MDFRLRLEKKKCDEFEKISLFQESCNFLALASNDIFIVISSEGIIQYVSPNIQRILGVCPEEVIGRNSYEFVEDKNKLQKLIESSLINPSKPLKADLYVKRKSGKKLCLETSLFNYLEEPSIEGILLNCRDITKRTEKQKRLVHTATHDSLTRLPNRLRFMRDLKFQCDQVQNNSTSFMLIAMDIDELKDVNSMLGYQNGDQLIIKIAGRLKDVLEPEDRIYRISGDKFAILIACSSNNPAGYQRLTEAIVDVFKYSFILEEYELYITMSMGASICTESGQDPDTILKQADLSLRKAKKQGKNRCEIFSSKFIMESYRQFVLRNDLQSAIEKDQLKMYYQPLVKLDSNEILAAEALIRWQHPVLGMVPPSEFIPLAEENGYIISLGKWILREVCRNYQKWSQSGLGNIKIAINYSTLQLMERDFAQNIIDTITEFGLDPHFLIIEITESVFLADFKQTKEKLNTLQEWGIQIALDDFGTGYSSLYYLSELDINILKIDRSFIKDINLKQNSSVITQILIRTSRELNLKIVAEGIETMDQLEALRKYRCHTGQGFIYSKPVSENDFEEILRKGTCSPLQKLS